MSSDAADQTQVGVMLGKIEYVTQQTAIDVREIKSEMAQVRRENAELKLVVAVMEKDVKRHDEELAERRASSRWTVWLPALSSGVALLGMGSAVVIAVMK